MVDIGKITKEGTISSANQRNSAFFYFSIHCICWNATGGSGVTTVEHIPYDTSTF